MILDCNPGMLTYSKVTPGWKPETIDEPSGNIEIKIDVRYSKNNLNRQEEIKMTLLLGEPPPSLLLI